MSDSASCVPVVAVEALRKSYHGHEVLRDVTFTINRGEAVVVMGPSGSGKSTLLRCVAGLEPIDGGRILFCSSDLSAAGRHIHKLRADIGVVFQSFNLFPHLTAVDNIMLAPIKVRGLSRADAHARALNLLGRVGLIDKAESYPEELSGGQQQRIAIARALAMEPRLMLFDEATSALDPEMTKEVLDVMLKLVQDGMTAMIVTHEMGFARRAADRVVFMDDGVILEDTSTARIFSGDAHPRSQQFLKQFLAY